MQNGCFTKLIPAIANQEWCMELYIRYFDKHDMIDTIRGVS